MDRANIAFMSYSHFDDDFEGNNITVLRERLSGAVRLYTGKPFEIFQDRKDIGWGQSWRERIDDSLDATTFLIPILTPNFFASDYCREEVKRFLEREQALQRNDLILPVYYIEVPELEDEALRATDTVVKALAAHQYANWLNLRYENFQSKEVRQELDRLAKQVRAALRRVEVARPVPSGPDAPPSPVSEQEKAAQPTSAAEPDSTEARPVVPREPPTHVVDAWQRGDHATIGEAIKAAQPGDRILIRPGLYTEGIVIDKPLEIVGEGPIEDIVVEATGQNAVLFKANIGRVANLTLRQMGGGRWVGVNITQGRLDLEGCDITSRSLACVAIRGRADPRVRGNRIHDGQQSGVFVTDGGRGTLEDNDIFGNGYAGVTIRNEGSNPTLRRNRIKGNEYEAVWVYENGGGTIEDNDLRGNTRGPWDVAKDSKAKVQHAGNQE